MSGDAFATTHWSLVLGARDEGTDRGAEALAELCRVYWPPLYAWLRRRGYSPADAEDFVQGFFERFVAREYLQDVEREKGRFRCFLIGALRHYVLHAHRRDRTQRRGGALVHCAFEDPGVAERCEAAARSDQDPEVLFDRVWAETVLARAARELRREYAEAGKEAQFDGLRRWLAAEARPGEYASAAPGLGSSEGALAVAVHRMRQRYRQLVRLQVAHTVTTPDQVDGELRHLLRVLRAAGT